MLSGQNELGELAKDENPAGHEADEGHAGSLTGGEASDADAIQNTPAIREYSAGGDFIGMASHIQNSFNGSVIKQWELDHGIERYIMGGVEYIRCRDWERFNSQLEEEKRAARQARLRARIAEEQERAYFGGGGQ